MAFRTLQTVRFGDIDYAGIVYYPRIVHYFHVGMEEFFAEGLGTDYARVLADHRFGLPSVHLEVDFLRPFKFGDRIEVEVAVEKIGNRSLTWRYRIFQRGVEEPSATARIVTACVDLDSFQSIPVPEWLVALLDGDVARPVEQEVVRGE